MNSDIISKTDISKKELESIRLAIKLASAEFDIVTLKKRPLHQSKKAQKN